MLALKAWTNQLRGNLRVFGTVLAGIEVKAIFTILKYVKIVPLGRFAQCYRSIFFQLAFWIHTVLIKDVRFSSLCEMAWEMTERK